MEATILVEGVPDADNRNNQRQRLSPLKNTRSTPDDFMFTTRPLTWLFIVATIVVDLVFLTTELQESEYRGVVSGCVLGQIAVLSIWAVRGSAHRLLRVSGLIIAVGILVQIWPQTTRVEALTVIYFYSTIIFVVAILARVSRYLAHVESHGTDQIQPIRFPIIEFFGWTIVVALISLGARYIDVDKFQQNSGGWYPNILLLVNPIIVALVWQRDFRDFKVFKILIIIVAVVTSEIMLHDFNAHFLITAQATYLIAWLTVITLDNIRVEANHVENILIDNSSSAEIPKIYDPELKN